MKTLALEMHDCGLIPGKFLIVFQEFFNRGILQINLKSGVIESISSTRIILSQQGSHTGGIELALPSINHETVLMSDFYKQTMTILHPEMKIYLFQDIEQGNKIQDWISALSAQSVNIGSNQLH